MTTTTQTVAVLTPDPHAGYAGRVDVALSHFAAAFARVGIRAVGRPWTDGPDPKADLHLAALAWGYDLQVERWTAAMTQWPTSAPLINAAELLLWNTRKTYLCDLDRAGVAVVPTVFVDDPADLPKRIADMRGEGVGEVVVKPQVSAGGRSTFRLRAHDEAPPMRGPVMLQPFLAAVAEEGELSLFVFGGRYGHAIAKRAAGGAFRVQPQHGGTVSAIEPPADALGLAYAAVSAAPAPAVYARVDMVRDAHGVLRVMELELIEPDLYPQFAPDALEGFVSAVLTRA